MTLRAQHTILLHSDSVRKAAEYQHAIIEGRKVPGTFFYDRLSTEYTLGATAEKKPPKSYDSSLSTEFKSFIEQMPVEKFYTLLSHTKQPVFLTERSLCADGSDWSSDEFALLADIVSVADVTIYANGERGKCQQEKQEQALI